MKILSFNKKYILLLSLFLFFTLFIYFATQKNLEEKVEFAKYNHLKTLQIHYETWLSNQTELADTIFFQTINTPQVLSLLAEASRTQDESTLDTLHEKLYQILNKHYQFYRSKGLLQYHFVLPDNRVFLRVHKEEKYGDDLTQIREDFNHVNTTHEIVRGFSDGRTAHALRNIYPIFFTDKSYIGAIEISFPSELVQQKLNDISDIHSHFLISKDIFQKKAWDRDDRITVYTQSVENQAYMVAHNQKHLLDKDLVQRETERIEQIKDVVQEKMSQGKIFSELSILNDQVKFISFYPIKHNITQEVVAWLVSYDDDNFIQTAIVDTLSARIIGFLMLLFFLYFLNRIITQNTTLKRLLTSYNENVIYSTIDLQGRITHVSKAFCNISGYAEKELLGKLPSIFAHPDMDESFFDKMWQEIQTTQRYKGEIKNLKKNGEFYWVDVDVQPDFDCNEKLIGYKVIRHDITDSKELEITQREVIFTMGSMGEIRSKETAQHVKRVAQYTELLAQLVSMDEHEVQILTMASPMHDIGKIAIPNSILHKPGELNEEEWKIMQTHAQIGYELLKSSQTPLLKAASIVAQQHHEKYDGSGYPQGLKADEIHLYGRITAIVDVYDALGSNRVYKKAWSEERISAYIQEQSGKQFDPKLVKFFLLNLQKFRDIRTKLAKSDAGNLI